MSTTLTIRALDPVVKAKLRTRAAENGRSMEEEARQILRHAVLAEPARGLGSRIHERFVDIGGVDLPGPGRDDPARVVDFPA